jgi:hypothetical protein
MSGTPLFSWQNQGPAVHYASLELENYYNVYMPADRMKNDSQSLRSTAMKIAHNSRDFLVFFLGPALCLPLALGLLMFSRRIRGVRLWTWQLALGFAALLLVNGFWAHYLAPMTASIFALIVTGLRILRRRRAHWRPVGIAMSRVVVLSAVVLGPFSQTGTPFAGEEPDALVYRAQFNLQLENTPGKHLVIVHYQPDHSVLSEWVYNGADLDNGKVVWAREIPGQDIRPLLQYYKGRQIWSAKADTWPPRLIPYLTDTR